LPRWGLPILFGGIGSNVVDRIWHGHSIDFIPIPFFDNSLIVFNPADLFQWIGAIILCKALADFHHLPVSNRSKILIMPKEQLHIAKNYFLVSICTGLVFSPFGVSYLRATLATGQLSHEVWNQILITYLLSSIFLALTCGIGAFTTGLYLAHRSAGALYAFERHVRSILAGEDNQTLTLRAEDRYQHLIELANDLKKHIDKKAS
jgi:signal peptidase II